MLYLQVRKFQLVQQGSQKTLLLLQLQAEPQAGIMGGQNEGEIQLHAGICFWLFDEKTIDHSQPRKQLLVTVSHREGASTFAIMQKTYPSLLSPPP